MRRGRSGRRTEERQGVKPGPRGRKCRLEPLENRHLLSASVGGDSRGLALAPRVDQVPDAAGRFATNQIVVTPSSSALALRSLAAIPGEPNVAELAFQRGTYLLSFDDAVEAREKLPLVQQLPGLQSAYALMADQMQSRFVPSDALFGQQVYAQNTGQTGGTAGEDIHVVPAWDQSLGTGVVIGIVDDGFVYMPDDLAQRFSRSLSYDFNNDDPDPLDKGFSHGTLVASLAAAAGDDSRGISGTAPGAQIAGIRLTADPTTDVQKANALGFMSDSIAVYNNSWGPVDDGQRLDAPGPLTAAVIANQATSGRGGLGTVYVWAGGNGRANGDRVTYDGFTSSRHVIAVGSVNRFGEVASYSEPGASLLTTAYGSQTLGLSGILNPPNSAYTDDYSGTSFSAPQVAGAVALMLEENPNLTLRDIQHILVQTARKNDATDGGWFDNRAGLHVHHDYGFGALDVAAAVTAARDWIRVPDLAPTIVTPLDNVGLAIPDDNGFLTLNRTINVAQNVKIEHVEVIFNATHDFRGDLEVVLTSPSGGVHPGTKSILADEHGDGGDNYAWTFTTVRDWGEESAGAWTLSVRDEDNSFRFGAGTTGVGTWDSWGLKIYGTPLGPSLPSVTYQTPGAGSEVTGAVTHVEVSFSEAIDPFSFSLVDVNSLTGPNGAIVPTGYSWRNPHTLRLDFAPQTTPGAYSLHIGPNIAAADDNSFMAQPYAGSWWSSGATAEIYGEVWHDLDNDGLRSNDDPGLENWPVYLDLDDNGVVGTARLRFASSDPSLPIPDNDSLISELRVTGAAGTIEDLEVAVNITHTQADDLRVFLISPAGTSVELWSSLGGSGDNFRQVILSDGAETSIADGTTPFRGRFRPENALAALAGENPNGLWRLEVIDDTAGDVGRLENWALTLSVKEPVVRTDSTGYYEFTGLTPGSYVVSDFARFEQTFGRLTLNDGDLQNIDFIQPFMAENFPERIEGVGNLLRGQLEELVVASPDLRGSLAESSVPNALQFLQERIGDLVDVPAVFESLAARLFEVAEIEGAPLSSPVLSTDAKFVVRVDGAFPVEITVSAAATLGNASLADLVADVNASISAAGLGTLVEADLSTGSELQIRTLLDSEGATLALSTLRAIASGSAPAFGQLTSDLTFHVSLDGGAPIAVLLRHAPVIVNSVIDASIPYTQNNVSFDDLIDDLNAALALAGVQQVVALKDGARVAFAAADPILPAFDVSNAAPLGFTGTVAALIDAGLAGLGLTASQAISALKYATMAELEDALQDAVTAIDSSAAPIDFVYDAPTNTVSFTLGFKFGASQDVSLDFRDGLSLGSFGTLEVAATADAEASATIDLNLRVNVDLSPLGLEHALSPAMTLPQLRGGEGIQLDVGLRGAAPLPANGQLSGPMSFDATVFDGTIAAFTVSLLPGAVNSGNFDAYALIEDINAAIPSPFVGRVEARALVDGSDVYLQLVALDPVIRSIELSAVSSAAALDLGFSNLQSGDLPELRIQLRDGFVAEIDLDGAWDLQDIADTIENALRYVPFDLSSPKRLLVTIEPLEEDALVLTDLSIPAAGFEFSVAAGESSYGVVSNVAAALGLVAVAAYGGGVITGEPLHGESQLDRVSIDETPALGADAHLAAALRLEATNLTALAGYGPLEIGIVNGQIDFTVETGLVLNDPGPMLDGRITLAEMFDAAPDDLLDLLPIAVSGGGSLPVASSFLSFLDLPTAGSPAFELTVGIDVPSNLPTISLAPNADLNAAFGDVVSKFQDLSFLEFLSLLRNVVEVLQEQGEAAEFLDAKLPLIDRSVNELLQLADRVTAVIDDLETTLDPARLDAALLALDTAIINLSIPLDARDPLLRGLELLRSIKTVITDSDANTAAGQAALARVPARLVTSVGFLRDLAENVSLVPLTDPGRQALLDAVEELKQLAPTAQELEAKLEAAIERALGTASGIEATVDFPDYNNSTSAREATIAVGLSFERSTTEQIGLALDLPSFGPIELQGSSNIALSASGTIDVGLGLRLSGTTPIPFLIVKPTSNTTVAPTQLTFEAGFNLPFQGGLTIGSLAGVTLDGKFRFTDAKHHRLTNYTGGPVQIPNTDTPVDTESQVAGAERNMVVAVDSGAGFVVLDPDEYTLSFSGGSYYVNFTTAPATGSTIDIEYLTAAMLTQPDPAMLTVDLNDPGFTPADGNTIGAVPLSDLFSTGTRPRLQTAGGGLITAVLDVTALGNTADDAATAVASLRHFDPKIQLDDVALVGLFENVEFDLRTIVAGIGLFLDSLEAGLTNDILAKLPVIGKGLNLAGTFIGELRDDYVTPFEVFLAQVNGTLDEVEADIQQFVYDKLGPSGLNILADTNSNGVDINDVVVTLTTEKFEILVTLGGEEHLETDFDLKLGGLPIGIETSGGVELDFDYKLILGVGVDRLSGFYLISDTSQDELSIDLDVGLKVDGSNNPTELAVKLFGLKLRATDELDSNQDSRTGFEGMLTVNIDDGGDGQVTVSELKSKSFGELVDANFTAMAGIHFDLAAETDNTDLPRILADLDLEWGFSAMNTATGIDFQYDPPSFKLGNARLDLGDFLTRQIKPVVDAVDKYIEPIRPLIEFLGQEVPGVTQLSQLAGRGPVTFLDLAFINRPDQAQAAKRFIGTVNTVLEVIDAINALGASDNIEIVFGSLMFGAGASGSASTLDLTQPNALAGADLEMFGMQQGTVSDETDLMNDLQANGSANVNAGFQKINRDPDANGLGGIGLKIQLIEEPINLFKILVGQTADIVLWDIPRFDLTIDFEKSFRPIPAVPPLKVEVGAFFNFFADLSVGFDTRGLVGTGRFTDGFYFGDLDPDTGVDIPEFGASLGGTLFAGLDVLVASAGIEGGIRADVLANWADRDADGKMYLDEIGGIIKSGGVECLFDITGEVTAFLRLVWEIAGSGNSKDIINEVIYRFMHECPHIEPGHVSDGGESLPDGSTSLPGDLIVHAGPLAGLRLGEATDVAEEVTVTELAPGVFEINAFGVQNRYSGVSRVVFFGGVGDDKLLLTSSHTAVPSLMYGGFGADTLIGSLGVDTIHGEGGDDTIDGGDGPDVIHGGQGHDAIQGGAGDDLIYGGLGNDTIHAGAGLDIVYGDAGEDEIHGEDDADQLFGNSGRDTIYGGLGHDSIKGGSGSDLLYGDAGDDTIDGGDGNDWLQGDTGDDWLYGGDGGDALLGGADSDTLLGGWGDDVIFAFGPAVHGPTFDTHYIEGGPGDDFICAGEGFDEIYGGTAAIGYPLVSLQSTTFGFGGYVAETCDDVPVLIEPAATEIVGRKFHDIDGDGGFDLGEPTLAGWTIELYDAAGDLVDVVVTGNVDLDNNSTIDPATESGVYRFGSLEPGRYTVREIAPSPWTNTTRGTITLIDVAVDPVSGDRFALAGGDLYRLDSTGAAAWVGPLGVSGLTTLEFLPDGRLFAMGSSDPRLFQLNTTSGAASPLFNTGVSSRGLTLAQGSLFVTNGSELLRLNPDTLSATTIGMLGVSGVMRLDTSSSDVLVITTGTGDLYLVSALTGAAVPAASGDTPQSLGLGGLPFDEALRAVAAVAMTEHVLLLMPGQSAADVDFFNSQLTPTVHGQKFLDKDGDGQRDADEIGLDGWTIEIYNDQNQLVASVETMSMDLNADGRIDPATEQGLFWFMNLEYGAYTVVEVLQPGWVQTLPGGDPQNGGDRYAIELTPHEPGVSLAFGNARAVAIHGQKFNDADGDGVFDVGEFGQNGVEIQLIDADTNEIIATLTTGEMDLDHNGQIDPRYETGLYWFTDLAPGTYIVREVLPSGFVPTTDGGAGPAGTLYGVGLPGADGSSNLYRLDTYNTVPVAVDLGETGLNLTDVAVSPTSGRMFAIGFGTLYELNPNTAAATRIGPLGVGAQNALAFAPDGTLYSLGHHWLHQVSLTTGAATPVFNTGLTSTGDLTFVTSTEVWVVTSTRQLAVLDLAAQTSSVVGDLGIAGLYGLEATKTGALYAAGATGSVYRIDLQAKVARLIGATGAAWAGLTFDAIGVVPDAELEEYEVTLESGEIAPDLDFGNYFPAEPTDGGGLRSSSGASIHGQKFHDLDGNGQRDPGEPGLDGWIIELRDAANNVVAITITMSMDLNADTLIDPITETGLYWFSGLAPGQYFVNEVQQTDWTQTTPGGIVVPGQLYAVESGISQFFPGGRLGSLQTIASPSSAPTPALVGLTDLPFNDLAIDPFTGTAYAITLTHLYQIDLNTGSSVLVGQHSVPKAMAADFGPDGQLYVLGSSSSMLFRVNPLNGATMPLFPVAPSSGDLAFDSDATLWVSSGLFLYQVDIFAQIVLPIGNHATTDMLFGLEVLDDGTLVGFGAGGPVNDAQMFVIDRTTGIATSLGTLNSFPEFIGGGLSLSPGSRQIVPGTTFYDVTLVGAASAYGIDFGNYYEEPPPEFGAIHGQKFHDLDNDGFRDPNEPGLDNWVIELRDSSGTVIATQVTMSMDLNADTVIDPVTERGLYWFENLVAGATYVVSEVQQPGWVQTLPASPEYVIVVPGFPVLGVDFGNYQQPPAPLGWFTDGADRIAAHGGDDHIWGDNVLPDPTIASLGQPDQIHGGQGSDTIFGQERNDTLTGGEDADALDGGHGTDRVVQTVDAHQTLTNSLLTGQGPDTLVSIEEATLAVASTVETSPAGNFTLDATAFTLGSVTLLGGSGDDTLLGSPQADVLDGGFGDDWLAAGAGDDRYVFGVPGVFAQVETLVELPGGGADTLDFSALPVAAPVNVNLTSDTQLALHALRTVQTGGSGQAAHFEHALGGSGDDTLQGNASANQLEGRDGNDALFGLAGNDLLDGGRGNDQLDGGADDDHYLFLAAATAEIDTIAEGLGGGNDTLDFSALAASDALLADLLLDTATVTHTNRTVNTAGAGQAAHFENILGGAGYDLLRGNAADNRLVGGAGNDLLLGRDGSDTLEGGRDDDRYVFEAAGAAQTDTVVELPGEGTDTLDLSALPSGLGVTVNLTSDPTLAVHSFRTVQTGAAGQAAHFEHVQGGAGDDSLTGNAADNSLQGNAGHDSLFGGAGNDTLDGGAGNDLLAGGVGDDLYVFAAAVGTELDTLSEAAGAGRDTLDLSALAAADPLVANLSSDSATLTHTGRVVNALAGEAAHFEDLRAGAGNDIITGNQHDNLLIGGAGDDRYLLLPASFAQLDTIVELAGGGVDTLDFSLLGPGQPVTINLSSDTALATQGPGIVQTGAAGQALHFENAIGGAAADTIRGNSRANLLIGGAGDDLIYGENGDDTLIGSAGTDTLDGGAGHDRYLLENTGSLFTDTFREGPGTVGLGLASGGGRDLLDLSAVTSAVTFDLAAHSGLRYLNQNVTLRDAAGNLNSDHFENVNGSATNPNVLFGNAADNVLTGGAFSDLLNGRGGNDTLIGGGQSDWYLFDDGWGQDTVVELPGEGVLDTLDFSAVTANLTATLASGQLQVTDGANLLAHLGDQVEHLVLGSGADTVLFQSLVQFAGGFGTIDGGPGFDTLDYSGYGATPVVNLSGGTATGTGGIANFENVVTSFAFPPRWARMSGGAAAPVAERVAPEGTGIADPQAPEARASEQAASLSEVALDPLRPAREPDTDAGPVAKPKAIELRTVPRKRATSADESVHRAVDLVLSLLSAN